ncbi:hypothetical protein BDR26DRAFT_880231 [Obelidium mucronatum]|nr:hypothetical protein BDR26DRAFT_880231 [Obelidium mucronatum]
MDPRADFRACARCRRFKKRCVYVPGGCERCEKSGHPCSLVPFNGAANDPSATSLLDQFINISETSLMDLEEDNRWNQDDCTRIIPATLQDEDEGDAPVVSNDSRTVIPVLELITNAAEAPLADHAQESSGVTGEIEDRDLFPTIEDWMLVHNVETEGGSVSPINFLYDSDNMLKTFFQLPPVFRMIRCALSSLEDPLQQHRALQYYSRTRKAVFRAIHERPTYQTVQGLCLLCFFASIMGQPHIGRPFLKITLTLIKTMQLDIDPDECPWLLNLTPRQKEDRRRAFWGPYWMLMMENAISNDPIPMMDINATRIKSPTAVVFNQCPIFETVYIARPHCQMLDLIAAIKKHHTFAPASIEQIFASESFVGLSSRLLSIHSQIPPDYLLLSDSPDSLTDSDCARFDFQLSSLGIYEKSSAFWINTEILIANSVLNRPVLYLSALESCHPMFLSTQRTNVIVNAINQSLDAALRVLNLVKFFLGAGQMYRPNQMDLYPILESVVVVWFVACKMKAVWWTLLNRSGGGRELGLVDSLLRERLSQTAEFVAKFAESAEGQLDVGTTGPIRICIEAMIKEIDGHGEEVGDLAIQEIVLGMKVVSLGESDTSISATAEPKAFLGLLGQQVGLIKWPGRGEESWALFWKLYS